LTNSSRLDPWGNLSSDGSRLFFLEREGDHWNTRQISVAGGESAPFGSSPRNTKLFAVSTDQSEMLFAPFALRSLDLPLWSMPLVGGAPRRVADIVVNSATFSPDGSQIAFTNTSGVFVASRDGSNVRQLAAFPWCWDIDWSPNGTLLRFSQGSQHLWQVTPMGRDLQPFLSSWTAREGRWTRDGSYYVFNATKNGRDSMWAVRESSSFPGLSPTPAPLASGPVSFGGALPSRDGRSIYAHGGLSEQFDVVRFIPTSHQFKPALPDINVIEVEFSPDHQWMLFSNRTQLWRSRADGGDRLLLAGPPSIPVVSGARWSPDSKRVLFEGEKEGRSAIFLVSADGGPPKQQFSSGPSRRWPDWAPDGQGGVFAVEEVPGETSPEPGIYSFDLAHGSSELVSGAHGMDQARLSPDGRFLAAVSDGPSAMNILDLKTHRWSEVARGTLISFPVWSADSVLYFQDILAPGEPVYRFPPGATGAQRVYGFEDILQSGAVRCAFWGFAPDGSLLVQVNRGGGDLYVLSVR
jgi:Tol biopolymer transport system component